MFEANGNQEPESELKMALTLVSPEVAQAMEDSMGGLAQCWPINNKQTLVAFASHLDHWNAIAAVARIEVLPLPRHFPLIFPSSEVPSRARSPATTIVLAIVAAIEGALAIWAVTAAGSIGEG